MADRHPPITPQCALWSGHRQSHLLAVAGSVNPEPALTAHWPLLPVSGPLWYSQLTGYFGSFSLGKTSRKGPPDLGTPDFFSSLQTAPPGAAWALCPGSLYSTHRDYLLVPNSHFSSSQILLLPSFLPQMPINHPATPIPLLSIWFHFLDFLDPPTPHPNKQERSDPHCALPRMGRSCLENSDKRRMSLY